MRTAALFGLLAMIPVALDARIPATITLSAPACIEGSAGPAITIAIPLRPGAPPPDGTRPCCIKGCHAGAARKRFQPDR